MRQQLHRLTRDREREKLNGAAADESCASAAPFLFAFPFTLPLTSRAQADSALHTLDLVVVALYFVFTLGVGLWVARQQRSATDYFLGARDLPAWAILLSIVATETSALTVISIPGIGARGDLTFLQLAFGYLLGRIGRGGVAPARLLPRRAGDGLRPAGDAASASARGGSPRVIFLVTRFLGDAVRVFASAIPLALVTGWSVPTSIVVMGVVTMIYTWFGGFKAVVWTDVLQLSRLSGGRRRRAVHRLVTWPAGPARRWAWRRRRASSARSIPSSTSPAPTPCSAASLGGALLSAASHGTDHLIVQRLLATRSLRDARVALVGSGRHGRCSSSPSSCWSGSAIWAAGLAPADMPGDQLFPRFVVEHLPAGLAGLVIAGILAAAMGTHSSAINSLASSATHDLYASWTGRTRPGAPAPGRPAVLRGLGARTSSSARSVFHYVGRAAATRPSWCSRSRSPRSPTAPLLGTYLLAGRGRAPAGVTWSGAVLVTVSSCWSSSSPGGSPRRRISRGSSRSAGSPGRGTCRWARCSRSAPAWR